MKEEQVEHTPGPWNIYTSNRPDGEYEIHTGTFDEAEHIASVSGGLGRLNNGGDPFCFESAANARLIAAAPDMLELLTDLVVHSEVRGISSAWALYKQAIKHTIVLATGKETE